MVTLANCCLSDMLVVIEKRKRIEDYFLVRVNGNRLFFVDIFIQKVMYFSLKKAI